MIADERNQKCDQPDQKSIAVGVLEHATLYLGSFGVLLFVVGIVKQNTIKITLGVIVGISFFIVKKLSLHWKTGKKHTRMLQNQKK